MTESRDPVLERQVALAYELGVVHELADGPLVLEDIAARADVARPTARVLLRALVRAGVAAETEEGFQLQETTSSAA